jgi:hypothetical protein
MKSTAERMDIIAGAALMPMDIKPSTPYVDYQEGK